MAIAESMKTMTSLQTLMLVEELHVIIHLVLITIRESLGEIRLLYCFPHSLWSNSINNEGAVAIANAMTSTNLQYLE